MSGWGRDYDDDPVLSLGDIQDALPDEDRAAFNALMVKAMRLLDTAPSTIDRLNEDNRRLKHQVSSYQGDLAATQLRLSESERQVERLQRAIADKQAVLELSDEMRAEALIAENKQLRERVEIQRRIIGRFERSATASPWQMFKDGLSSVFADPLTAVANAKAP